LCMVLCAWNLTCTGLLKPIHCSQCADAALNQTSKLVCASPNRQVILSLRHKLVFRCPCLSVADVTDNLMYTKNARPHQNLVCWQQKKKKTGHGACNCSFAHDKLQRTTSKIRSSFCGPADWCWLCSNIAKTLVVPMLCSGSSAAQAPPKKPTWAHR